MGIEIPFLNVKAACEELKEKLDDAYYRVTCSGWFVLGREVVSFKRENAAYWGIKHCIGAGNGLEAFYLILRAYDIGSGDDVIVPANTYIATWLAVTYAGARPILVEPVEEIYNLALDFIEATITPQTKAIFAVHLYDLPADMNPITKSH